MKIKQPISDLLETSDLCLSATLSIWFPLDAVDRKNPQKVEFYFKKDESLEKILESYWRGELRIEPKQFFSQLKILKSRIYEER